MKQSNRLNRARYGLYAPVYDLAARPLERGRQRAIERLALSSDDRVLVVGCATGSDLAYLPAGTSVSAIDLTPGMVDRTRDRAASLDLDVDVRVGDARSLPYRDGAFDAVLLHLVLSVVSDPRAVAAETERVLAPGGRISIYDKFAPAGRDPSPIRRAINPVARLLFSDTTRRLGAILADTALEPGEREQFLGGVYTVTVARRATPEVE